MGTEAIERMSEILEAGGQILMHPDDVIDLRESLAKKGEVLPSFVIEDKLGAVERGQCIAFRTPDWLDPLQPPEPGLGPLGLLPPSRTTEPGDDNE